MPYFDAHNHLHDARLKSLGNGLLPQLGDAGIAGVVVNGTSEKDWEDVRKMAQNHSWVVPSYGLHPWFVADRTKDWQDNLLRFLDENPHAGVGECGLDRWMDHYDIHVQTEVFQWQTAVSAERNLPLSIHCIRAWGALLDCLKQASLPRRGFLLHAYAGPEEMVQSFVKLGAYFSFSPYFLHPRKSAQREVFSKIPEDRVLVETDAPDMAPPLEENSHPFYDQEGKLLNHPLNLLAAYETLAKLRKIPQEKLSSQVEQNWKRLFGSGS